MKVLITTLGRCHNQVTLKNLHGSSVAPILVVQAHEYDIHKSTYPAQDVLELPEYVTRLGATRRYLCEKFNKNKLVLLDDDLTFYYRPTPGDWHLKPAAPPQIDKMFAGVEEALTNYAHVSVSAREGNNTVSEDWVENTRYMRFLAYNTGLFPGGLEIGRVDGMSDFDLNLQLLKAGKRSRVLFSYAQNHPGTQAAGGCSLQRTHATHEEEIRKMLEWHAPFVKARQKRNKTGGEFGTRTELTVFWKKAFESSKQKSPG